MKTRIRTRTQLCRLWSRIYRAERKADAAAVRTYDDREYHRQRGRSERCFAMRLRVEELRHTCIRD